MHRWPRDWQLTANGLPADCEGQSSTANGSTKHLAEEHAAPYGAVTAAGLTVSSRQLFFTWRRRCDQR